MVYDFGRNGGGRFFLRTEPLSPPPPPTFFFERDDIDSASATNSSAQARGILPSRLQHSFTANASPPSNGPTRDREPLGTSGSPCPTRATGASRDGATSKG
eukprot:270686_1